MRRRVCAPATRRWVLAAAVFCAVAASPGRSAPRQAASAPSNPNRADPDRRVRTFDFDERRLGNYEDTPMHWRRLTGEGLPAYSTGQLDDAVGHSAPPSFLFMLKGGNIAHEYAGSDVTVSPDADYLIEGYVRAEGLECAQALIVCYLADQSGERIAGSERISNGVRNISGTGPGADGGWQRVEIPLHIECRSAHALRLQLWVLQDYVLQEEDATSVAPIVRQEVDARVWFDDIAIVRVPRMRLRFSNSGGIINPGAAEALHLDIHNGTLGTLRAELAAQDGTGHEHLRETFAVAPGCGEEFRVPVPRLPPGLYRADARLMGDGATIIGRTICFAVLPELSVVGARAAEFGVDLGPWPGGNPDGAAELITNLGCAAVKVGVPMIGRPRDDQEQSYLRQIRDLARRLTSHQIETTGVILPATRAEVPDRDVPTFRTLMAGETWAERVGPVLVYLDGHLSAWQLGCERVELREPVGWSLEALGQVRGQLERFTAVRQLIVPRSVFDADAVPPAGAADQPAARPLGSGAGLRGERAGPDAYSFWLPAELPARAFPEQLVVWSDQQPDDPQAATGPPPAADNRAGACWLSLGLERDQRVPAADRVADMARRIVLANAANPQRLHVPAPFELSTAGGDATWQPTDEYIPLRTLLHHLSGQRAAASFPLPHNAVALLFSGGQRHTLVVWTWQQGPSDAAVELCVGSAASAVELTGTRRALVLDGPQARVPLSPAPLVVQGVDGPLLLLQQSVRVEPALIQLHEREPRPVLMLRNPYPVELAAAIELHPPRGWGVTPNTIPLKLGAAETLAQRLDFDIPPRQSASEQVLGVDIRMAWPEPVVVHREVPVQVGLKDIALEAVMHWDGEDLVIAQALLNLSPHSVSFSSFCQPPQRAQLEGVLLNVPPGETGEQVYRLANARELAGAQLWLGVQEIGGPRTLDQLVPVPR